MKANERELGPKSQARFGVRRFVCAALNPLHERCRNGRVGALHKKHEDLQNILTNHFARESQRDPEEKIVFRKMEEPGRGFRTLEEALFVFLTTADGVPFGCPSV